MKATLYTTDNREIEIEPLNGETFDLHELYGILKCELIEVLTLRGSDDIMIIDEEGKFNSPEINEKATEIARKHRAIFPSDYIAGMAIVCHTDMLD